MSSNADILFVIASIIFAVVTVIICIYAIPRIIKLCRLGTAIARSTGHLSATPPGKSLAVTGTASGRAQTSLFGNIPCVFWHSEVERYDIDPDIGVRWLPIFSQSSNDPIVISCSSGYIKAVPEGSKLNLKHLNQDYVVYFEMRPDSKHRICGYPYASEINPEILIKLEKLELKKPGVLDGRVLRVSDKCITSDDKVFAYGIIKQHYISELGLGSTFWSPLMLGDGNIEILITELRKDILKYMIFLIMSTALALTAINCLLNYFVI